MRANRYLVATVAAALAVSFVLPSVASAQEEPYMRGVNAYQQGNFSEAERIFRDICAEYEDAGQPWGWCHMMLGITLGRQGSAKRQEALAQLEIAKDLVTEDTERYQTNFAIANIQLLDERWGQAIAAADVAATFGGAAQVAAVAKVKGQAYYQQQQWADAATELAVAVDGRAGDANLHAWLGRSLYELDRKDEALPHLTQAGQIDRSNRIGLYFAAQINLENGNYTQATALAERAIQSHPQDTNIRKLLGLSYLGDGNFADAIQQFEVVIADRPTDAAAIYNLGQAYLATENWGKAAEQFQKAQNMFAAGSINQGKLLYDLGVALERLTRNTDALRAFMDSQAISDNIEVEDAIERVQERIRRAKGGGGQ